MNRSKEEIKRIVLAYSGGLDTAVMLKWLVNNYDCEVITYTADVGQEDELDGLEEKALQMGAAKVVVEDLKEEFVREYVFTALKAAAIYEGSYLLGTSLARPLIASRQAQIASREGADAVAHGATGKGNDQVRFELAYQSVNPELKVVAPWREWDFCSRKQLIAYADQHKIPVKATHEKPYSIDRNLMHVSFEGGVLEDPWQEAPEEMFMLTQSPERAPDVAEYLKIEFKKGVPVSVNDEELEPVALLESLNERAGLHGVGRVDLVENRYVGMKSRGIYETPGMTVLHVAHRALESITLDREVSHLRDSLGAKISELIYYGYWFAPEFRLLRELVEGTQRSVTGTVRVKLFKGSCWIVGRRAPGALYSRSLASFDQQGPYNPQDAEGFIRLNGLRLRMQKIVESRQDKPEFVI